MFRRFEKQAPNISPFSLNTTIKPPEKQDLSTAANVEQETKGQKRNRSKNHSKKDSQILKTINKCEYCTTRLQSVQNYLQQITEHLNSVTIRLQSLQSPVDRRFLQRIIALQGKMQKVQYTLWEYKEFKQQDRIQLTQTNTKLHNVQTKLMAQICEIRNRIPKQIHYTQSHTDEGYLLKKIEGHKSEQNRKFRSLIDALQEIGKLQVETTKEVNNIKIAMTLTKNESAFQEKLKTTGKFMDCTKQKNNNAH